MNQLCDALDPYDLLVKKTMDKFIPFKLDWELTYRCNLKCAHCYQTGLSYGEELSTKKIYSILDELASLGCLYITFTGGEILLRKDFLDIAQYARKKNFALRLFTNGTLIDPGTADKIKDLRPLSVEISLYGMDARIHERITQTPGSYEKTRNALELLKERGVNTVVKCTVMNENVSEFDKLKEFAQSIGSKFVFSLTVIPRVDGADDVLRFRLSEQELREVFVSRDWLIDEIAAGGIHSYKPLCSAGINSLYISPTGEVFPCVALREPCGSVTDFSLKEILDSPFFEKIRRITFEDLPQCSRCDLAHYCDRCAGLALLEAKDLMGPSPNECKLAKVRRWVMEQKEVGYEKRSKKEILL